MIRNIMRKKASEDDGASQGVNTLSSVTKAVVCFAEIDVQIGFSKLTSAIEHSRRKPNWLGFRIHFRSTNPYLSSITPSSPYDRRQ